MSIPTITSVTHDTFQYMQPEDLQDVSDATLNSVMAELDMWSRIVPDPIHEGTVVSLIESGVSVASEDFILQYLDTVANCGESFLCYYGQKGHGNDVSTLFEYIGPVNVHAVAKRIGLQCRQRFTIFSLTGSHTLDEIKGLVTLSDCPVQIIKPDIPGSRIFITSHMGRGVRHAARVLRPPVSTPTHRCKCGHQLIWSTTDKGETCICDKCGHECMDHFVKTE